MQADLVLGAKRCFQCGLWVLKPVYTPDSKHFCCPQQQVLTNTCIWQTCFPFRAPKYTFWSGLIIRVHLKVPRFLYSPKPWERSTLKSMLTQKTYQWLKISWNKLYQAVCCFGLHYRLLFLSVKHKESHSPPASVALALPAPPVVSFIGQFQRHEHCGCALVGILSIATAPQPLLRHRQCKSPVLQDSLLISLLANN